MADMVVTIQAVIETPRFMKSIPGIHTRLDILAVIPIKAHILMDIRTGMDIPARVDITRNAGVKSIGMNTGNNNPLRRPSPPRSKSSGR